MPLIDVGAALAQSTIAGKICAGFACLARSRLHQRRLTGDDALRAIDEGAAAVVVSNHGGRQLDGVQATLRAMPEIVGAVNGQTEVLMDGGIRRGADIVKHLPGRPRRSLRQSLRLWLAAAGEAGVARASKSCARI